MNRSYQEICLFNAFMISEGCGSGSGLPGCENRPQGEHTARTRIIVLWGNPDRRQRVIGIGRVKE